MAYCEQCGAAMTSETEPCAQCGAVRGPTPRDIPPAAAPVSAVPTAFANLPVELWLVIVAFSLPGAWIVLHALDVLPDTFKVMDFSFRLGLALTLLVGLVGVVGAGMLWIAWRLYKLDRVGRGLAYVFAGTLVASVIFGSDSNGSDVAALLGSLAGTAILYFSPSVNAAFDNAAQGDMPTSIVASRVSLNVFCVVAGVAAAVYLLLATFQGRYVVVAVVIIAAVVAAQKLADQVMGGNRDARQQLSLGTAGFVLLALVLGKFSVGLMIPLGLAMATIGCLWIPNDARSFFGDPPLGDQPTAP